jgi:tetratricopeptide (TPR) repeat protein
VEEHDGNAIPYAGEVALYYPKGLDPVYSAVAQVKDLANIPAGLTRLERVLAGPTLKDAEPYFVLGEALRGLGQTAKAIPIYQRALKIEPGNWRFLYGLGQAWQASGEPDRAVDAFQRAIALAPAETNLLYGLGAAYESQGRIPEAIRTFRDASQRNPEDAPAVNNLGIDLNKAGDAKGAEEALREAIRLQPETMVFHVNLAGLLAREGKRPEAEHELEEAIRYGPSTVAEAELTLGGILVAAGQPEEGKAHLKRAMDSQDPRIRAAAARLFGKL